MLDIQCQAWVHDQRRQKGFLPLLHVGRDVVALQTVGWLVPSDVNVFILTCKCTFYFAAIVYAEINISKDGRPADAVVLLGNSTQCRNIPNSAVFDDSEEELRRQACERDRLAIIHIEVYFLMDLILLDQARSRNVYRGASYWGS